MIVSSTPTKGRGGRKGYTQEQRDLRSSQGVKRSFSPDLPDPIVDPDLPDLPPLASPHLAAPAHVDPDLPDLPPEQSDKSVPSITRQRTISDASLFDGGDWDDSTGFISGNLELFERNCQRTNLAQDLSRSSTPDSMGKLNVNNLNI